MVNMLCFEDACGLIEHYNLYGRIGIHLNLTGGYPITKKMSICKKFCDADGKFKSQRSRLFWLDKENKKVVYDEFEAQLNKLLDRNIIPTHIDSHHHYHTEWAIGKQVIKLAQKNNIGAVRLSRNCGGGTDGIKKIYKNIYNLILSFKGLSKVQYFGLIEDVLSIRHLELYSVEAMVHPGYDKRAG